MGNDRASVEHSQAAQLPQLDADPNKNATANPSDPVDFRNATDAGIQTSMAKKLRCACRFFETISLYESFLVRHLHGGRAIKLR